MKTKELENKKCLYKETSYGNHLIATAKSNIPELQIIIDESTNLGVEVNDISQLKDLIINTKEYVTSSIIEQVPTLGTTSVKPQIALPDITDLQQLANQYVKEIYSPWASILQISNRKLTIDYDLVESINEGRSVFAETPDENAGCLALKQMEESLNVIRKAWHITNESPLKNIFSYDEQNGFKLNSYWFKQAARKVHKK